MDEDSKKILNVVGINIESINDLEFFLLPREQLLSDLKYQEIQILIPELKKNLVLLL